MSFIDDPIELTPGILEKLGFVKGEKWFIHQIYYIMRNSILIELCYNKNEIVYGDKTDHGFNKKSINLKYFHQLQSLYAGLTGGELNL
jgi:hypothetical protein